MVIAHLFLFCPSFQRLWSLRKSLKIHFYSSQSVTVTFCFQLRNCNTSPYNNHSQVGKVLGTSTSELCEGKRISWKYPQKTNKQTKKTKCPQIWTWTGNSFYSRTEFISSEVHGLWGQTTFTHKCILGEKRSSMLSFYLVQINLQSFYIHLFIFDISFWM